MSKIATRKSFGEALAQLGEKYPEVVALDADLAKSTQSHIFASKFPDRFFEMGIQEANMIGTAAGLSFCGKIPFICSFGAFLTGRYDQIRMSIGYANANVKLIGTHCGVGIGEDGHSQMGLEDLALMRAIPGMTVLQPGDDKECREMIEWGIKHTGPVYYRLTRQGLAQYNMSKFELGHFPCLKETNSKVAFLGTGALLEMSLEASIQIPSNPSVYNLSTVKPFNHKFLEKLFAKYDTFVVFEDHTNMGGSFSALSEWNVRYAKTPKRIYPYGVEDVFGESGTPSDLYKKHKFTTQDIVHFGTKL